MTAEETPPESLPDLERVRHVARLARLELTPDEEQRFAPQLAACLEAFRSLGVVDITGIEPFRGLWDAGGALREDEPRPSLDREAVLERAPEARDGFFVVPKAVHRPGPGKASAGEQGS
jgi:aspartyl-tRNA(Asn)/glutamyl-tRNA(Gln) amidotransferase subunit C